MTALENVSGGRHIRNQACWGPCCNPATMAEEVAIRARHRPAALRRHRGPSDDRAQEPVLRRPAPPRNRPRAGHRAQAAGAGRAGRRHERHRNRAEAR